MEQEEFLTTRSILESILSMDPTDEKLFDISLIETFVNGLPPDTTINKIFKETPTIKQVLEELLDIASNHINSKTLYNNLINIFRNLTSNTEFDYYKEVALDG